MTTRDEPLDPQEVLEAAEAAHLAARRTVRISRSEVAEFGDGDRTGGRWEGGPAGGPVGDDAPGDEPPTDGRDGPAAARWEPDPADRPHSPAAPMSAGADRAAEPPGGADRPDSSPPELYRHTPPQPRTGNPAAAARRRAPLPLAAAVAATWAALLTFTPVLLVVTLLPAVEAGTAMLGGPVRVAAAGWLLAHGVPLETPAGPIGLIPLTLAAFAAWRVARAGVHVTRVRGGRGSGSLRQALLPAAAVAVAYGGIGMLLAVPAGGPEWGPAILRAGLTLALFGFLTAGLGSVYATGALSRLYRRTPVALRAGGRAGLVAALGILAAGAATAGTALAVGGGPAAEVVAAYGTGVAGQVGLTALCLAYAPNLTVWAAAYLVGPGFAVGTDTVVRSSEVVLGPVPAVPVLAVLPTGPLPPAVGAALWAVPVVAGAAAGWLLARSVGRWGALITGAVVAGVVAAGVLGVAAALAGGPLGGGQLAVTGPSPVQVALYVVATVPVGTLVGGLAAGLSQRRGS